MNKGIRINKDKCEQGIVWTRTSVYKGCKRKLARAASVDVGSVNDGCEY